MYVQSACRPGTRPCASHPLCTRAPASERGSLSVDVESSCFPQVDTGGGSRLATKVSGVSLVSLYGECGGFHAVNACVHSGVQASALCERSVIRTHLYRSKFVSVDAYVADLSSAVFL